MSEPERVTRKQRIDTRLTSALLNWTIIPWKDRLNTSELSAHAVEEFPTVSGPADYALFVEGKLLGIIEAKKLTVGAEGVLEQAKRDSRNVANTVGEWRGYTVAMFRHKVYSYITEQAVLEGFLVDYDALKITSDVKINGAFLKEGELVGEIDMETGVETFENNISLQRETVSIAEIIERIYDNRDRKYNTKRLIKRLRRIEANMGAEARAQFAQFIPDGDLKTFIDRLPENLKEHFSETMKLLRNKDFQNVLVNYKRPRKVFFKGYDVVDSVEDEVMFRVDSDYQKPEDYLKSFERFVQENPAQIEAIEILLTKPRNWNTDALEKLRDRLKRSNFREKDLQKAHKHVYYKPLADIISMIKHAADFQVPLLNAQERVKRAFEVMTGEKNFNPEQQEWLAYIREHVIENLAIAAEDFEIIPVFERRGGLGKAKKVFGSDDLNKLIDELNSALAA